MASLRFWFIFALVIGIVFGLGGLSMVVLGIYIIATRERGAAGSKVVEGNVMLGLELLLPGLVLCAIIYQVLAWFGAKITDLPTAEPFRCSVQMSACEVLLWCAATFLCGGGGISMLVMGAMVLGDNAGGSKTPAAAIGLFVGGGILLVAQALGSIFWCFRRCNSDHGRDEESTAIITRGNVNS